MLSKRFDILIPYPSPISRPLQLAQINTQFLSKFSCFGQRKGIRNSLGFLCAFPPLPTWCQHSRTSFNLSNNTSFIFSLRNFFFRNFCSNFLQRSFFLPFRSCFFFFNCFPSRNFFYLLSNCQQHFPDFYLLTYFEIQFCNNSRPWG